MKPFIFLFHLASISTKRELFNVMKLLLSKQVEILLKLPDNGAFDFGNSLRFGRNFLCRLPQVGLDTWKWTKQDEGFKYCMKGPLRMSVSKPSHHKPLWQVQYIKVLKTQNTLQDGFNLVRIVSISKTEKIERKVSFSNDFKKKITFIKGNTQSNMLP